MRYNTHHWINKSAAVTVGIYQPSCSVFISGKTPFLFRILRRQTSSGCNRERPQLETKCYYQQFFSNSSQRIERQESPGYFLDRYKGSELKRCDIHENEAVHFHCLQCEKTCYFWVNFNIWVMQANNQPYQPIDDGGEIRNMFERGWLYTILLISRFGKRSGRKMFESG